MHYAVSGANRGLGLEFVRTLLKGGHRVSAGCRTPDRATELAKLAAKAQGQCAVFQLDVTDDASVAGFAESVDGPIDVLINNAGLLGEENPLATLDFAHLRQQFEVNSIAPLRVTRALLPAIQQGSTRKVLNITSRMGSIADNESGGHYGYRATKTALNMLNSCMAHELRPNGITSLVIHPGWVATDMGGESAPLSAVDSVRGMLEVLERATLADSGRFLQHDGEEIPW